MHGRARGLALAGLVVLASLLLPGGAVASSHDPPEDVVGWEGGVWHNESIAVDQSDGLSPAERAAFVNRTAARIEVLRGREFDRSVPVEVISRAEYRELTTPERNESYAAWNNQVWEALFLVGEDRDVQEVLRGTATDRTVGAYFFESDEIKIVAGSPSDVAIDRRTLAHELVHAQQDQYHDLTNLTAGATTQDEQLARNGLVEGEARYLELRYEERCGVEWECVDGPGATGGSGSDLNLGVYFTLIHPYSDGPPYVRSLIGAGGWEAVEAAFSSPPNSTEQVIHRTAEEPTPLSVDDEATDGWEPFPAHGRNGTDTAGEASMFAMMWHQAAEYDADTVPRNVVLETDDRYDLYNYVSTPTEGWANDAIVPYRRPNATGDGYGYVWVTAWDTEADAREFRRAHLQVLAAHDARRIGPRTLVVDSGPFADAFRVDRDGRLVTVVNAPRVRDLDALRPSVTGVSTDPAEETPSAPTRASPMEPEDTASDDGVTPAPSQPGFGVLAAVAGLLVAWLVRRRA